MKATHIINKLSYKAAERISLFAAAAAVLVGVGGTALAYGPERQTYTINKPATKVTFNAITDNPNYGDERNFVKIKDAANTAAGGWSDTVNVQGGKEYLVRMYVHNNAAENLNLVAQNVRAKANVPNNTANSIQIDGFISASNASPQQVWDDVVLKSDKKFNIAYVQGSSRYYNNVNPSTGFALTDSIVTSAGTPLGYQSMDGKIPGCFKFSGYVTFKVKAQTEATPNFTVDKKVRVKGTSAWQDSVKAKPGQEVEYQVEYDNTGETQQNDVVIKDVLPKNVLYINGTSSLKNATNPGGLKVSDRVTSSAGMNIGNYTANSNAKLQFSALLPGEDKLAKCGANTLRNTATVDTDNGSKSDTADVIIDRVCKKDECKPGIPTGDKRCNPCPVPGKEHLAKNDPGCEAPCTPAEGQVVDEQGNCVTATPNLPKTGPTEVALGLIGLAAIVAGITYWVKSRRELSKAIATGGESKKADDAPKLLTARTETHKEDDKKDF